MKESSFVEMAAREAAEAELVEGDERADLLLQRARASIYHWPSDFTGFHCRLEYTEAASTHSGSFRYAGSRDLSLDLPSLVDQRGLRFQLEELMAHREAPSQSKMASKTGCSWGDWDPIYGRRIDFLGDKMSSFYRIAENKLCQIGRSYKNQNFIINIDQHQDCAGQWVAAFYNAYYWNKEDGRLSKTETYVDHYGLVEGLYLPLERRVSVAAENGMQQIRIRFLDFRLEQRNQVLEQTQT